MVTKKDILDWISRSDGSDFVRVNNDKRAGWDIDIDSDSTVSSYLLKGVNDEYDLISKAKSMANDLISALNLPFKVKINFTSSSSYTDGSGVVKNIAVSTNYFDSTSLSKEQKIDIFLGLVAHEIGHTLFTPVTPISAFEDSIHRNLTNIIEDERMECKLCERYPGLSNYIARIKNYYFSQNPFPDTLKCTRNAGLINVILKIVRYPSKLTDEELVIFPNIGLIEKYISPLPSRFEDVLSSALEIRNLLFDMADEKSKDDDSDDEMENDEEDSSEKDNEDNSDENNEDQSSTSDEQNDSYDGEESDTDTDENGNDESKDDDSEDTEDGDGEGETESSDKDKKSSSSSDKGGGKSSDKSSKGDKGSSSKSSSTHPGGDGGSSSGDDKSSSITLDEEAVKEALEKLKDSGLFSDRAGDTKVLKGKDECSLFKHSTLEGKVLNSDGLYEFGSNRKSVIEYPEKSRISPREPYENILKRVSPYITGLRKPFMLNSKNYSFDMRSMRSGVLDTSKLCEAIQGVPNVYTRKCECRTNDINVCILVDQSGSMSCGGRIAAAREVAVLIYEAVIGIKGINPFIYGHSADDLAICTTELINYIDTKRRDKKLLTLINARQENRDGDAILECAKQVKKQDKYNRTIMIILSDGNPSALHYRGSVAREDTRNKVLQVERMGIDVIQVGISDDVSSKDMFKNYVTLTDLKTLAFDLGKVLKGLILKNSQHSITK